MHIKFVVFFAYGRAYTNWLETVELFSKGVFVMSRQITGAVIEELNAPFKLETLEVDD